jgi:hypothetical protein
MYTEKIGKFVFSNDIPPELDSEIRKYLLPMEWLLPPWCQRCNVGYGEYNADNVVPEKERGEVAARRDLTRIRNYLNRNFDTRSRWNGDIEIDSAVNIGAAGKTYKNGKIAIASQVAERHCARWNTMLHEMLHTIEEHSGRDYAKYFGWIEGTLEGTLRQLRPHMLDELGVEIPKQALQWRDETHHYNGFVNVIEGLRKSLGETDAETFYYTLFATPFRERPDKLRSMAETLPEKQRKQFERSLKGAMRVLGGEK